tara:strand:- start:623 stop:796 length:174 start_codon:yes stop_codon:yes gene_type:complete
MCKLVAHAHHGQLLGNKNEPQESTPFPRQFRLHSPTNFGFLQSIEHQVFSLKEFGDF